MTHHVAVGNPETRLEALERSVHELTGEVTRLAALIAAKADEVRENGRPAGPAASSPPAGGRKRSEPTKTGA